MKIGIWGTKAEALYLSRQLKVNTNLCVNYFIDNNSNQWGKVLEGNRVISYVELLELYGKEIERVIIAARGIRSRLSIIRQLKELGIENIGVFKYSAYDLRKKVEMNDKGLSEYVVWINEINKPVIPYLETHVADSCNLKCKGCTHFANLFNENDRIEYEEFVKDIDRVSQKAYVVQLRLLGGEPLLNKECYRYITHARKAFPNADISIVTNGLLIPAQEQLLFDSMKKNHVSFYISLYQPTLKIKDLIEQKCKENEVDCFFENEGITEFGKHLSMTGNSDTARAQAVCLSSGCRFLRKGHLYKCPTEGLISKFAEIYGDVKVLQEERGIDIYNEEIDWGTQLGNWHLFPVPMCKYCAERCEMFRWEIKNNPDKSDWLV